MSDKLAGGGAGSLLGERPPESATIPPVDVFTECSRRVEERWWNEVKLPEVQP